MVNQKTKRKVKRIRALKETHPKSKQYIRLSRDEIVKYIIEKTKSF